MTFTFIEVCAGAGGLSYGLEKAGLQPLVLNDIDKDCCKTLELNKKHQTTKIICESLEKMDLSEYTNKVDLLTGGVPCQAFSTAGKRLGFEDTRGMLVFKFIDLIRKLKPKMFLIENVKGLLSHDDGNTLKIILEELKLSNNYTVSYKLLNSVNFEVPQKRERIIIVGIKQNENVVFNFPKEQQQLVLLKDVLINVPNNQDGCSSYSGETLRLFKKIPQGGCWINLTVDEQKEYLGKSYESGGGKRGILRRLSMNEPCLTLLCSPQQKQTQRCHPIEDRPLSVREYARIQTFPDDYVFSGSISSKYKQIGNAVPCNLGYHIGKEIIKTLEQLN